MFNLASKILFFLMGYEQPLKPTWMLQGEEGWNAHARKGE